MIQSIEPCKGSMLFLRFLPRNSYGVIQIKSFQDFSMHNLNLRYISYNFPKKMMNKLVIMLLLFQSIPVRGHLIFPIRVHSYQHLRL